MDVIIYPCWNQSKIRTHSLNTFMDDKIQVDADHNSMHWGYSLIHEADCSIHVYAVVNEATIASDDGSPVRCQAII